MSFYNKILASSLNNTNLGSNFSNKNLGSNFYNKILGLNFNNKNLGSSSNHKNLGSSFHNKKNLDYNLQYLKECKKICIFGMMWSLKPAHHGINNSKNEIKKPREKGK